MGAIDSVKPYIDSMFGIPQYLNEANSLANANGYSWVVPREAIRHVYTSAMVTFYEGALVSDTLGYGKECFSTTTNPDLQADNCRDLWNNEIGKQIAQYVIANDYAATAAMDNRAMAA